jgi:hypothetical protein
MCGESLIASVEPPRNGDPPPLGLDVVAIERPPLRQRAVKRGGGRPEEDEGHGVEFVGRVLMGSVKGPQVGVSVQREHWPPYHRGFKTVDCFVPRSAGRSAPLSQGD